MKLYVSRSTLISGALVVPTVDANPDGLAIALSSVSNPGSDIPDMAPIRALWPNPTLAILPSNEPFQPGIKIVLPNNSLDRFSVSRCVMGIAVSVMAQNNGESSESAAAYFAPPNLSLEQYQFAPQEAGDLIRYVQTINNERGDVVPSVFLASGSGPTGIGTRVLDSLSATPGYGYTQLTELSTASTRGFDNIQSVDTTRKCLLPSSAAFNAAATQFFADACGSDYFELDVDLRLQERAANQSTDAYLLVPITISPVLFFNNGTLPVTVNNNALSLALSGYPGSGPYTGAAQLLAIPFNAILRNVGQGDVADSDFPANARKFIQSSVSGPGDWLANGVRSLIFASLSPIIETVFQKPGAAGYPASAWGPF